MPTELNAERVAAIEAAAEREVECAPNPETTCASIPVLAREIRELCAAWRRPPIPPPEVLARVEALLLDISGTSGDARGYHAQPCACWACIATALLAELTKEAT